jgi:hypothetical protein
LQAVIELAQRGDLRENALSFVVGGHDRETQRLESVDVLKDHLISNKKIVRMNHKSRALDDNAAYDAIEEAYRDLRTDLEAAASVAIAQ